MNKIKKGHILLIAILFAGFILRIWGINFGLPYQFHQDESMAVNHAIAYGSGDFNPHYFQLPPLLSYVLFFLYAIFYVLGRLFNFFQNSDAFLKLFLQDPTTFYLIARIFLGLVPGVISIILVYKLALAISNKNSACLSALFLSLSFLHIRDCHYVYHDIPLIMFLLLTFIYIFKYAATDKLKNIILAGVFAGIATGFKYNGILIIIPALIGPWFYRKNKPSSMVSILRINILFFAVFCLLYFISNPYSVLDFKSFMESIFSEKGAHVYVGWLYHIVYSAFEGMGLLLTVISFFGFIAFIFSKDLRKKLIAFFIFLSYLSIVFFGQIHERYILPILPFLTITASICVVDFSGRFTNKKIQKIFLIILSMAIVLVPLCKSVYSDILFSRNDTRVQATAWIVNNLPQATTIALDHSFFSPKLIQSPRQMAEKINLLESKNEFGARLKKARILKEISQEEKSYNVFFLGKKSQEKFIFSFYPTIDFNIDEIFKQNIAYVVLHLDYPSQVYPEAEFINSLLHNANLIKIFNPYKNEYFDLKNRISTTSAPFLWREIFNRNTNGPVLLVYKLNALSKR